MREAPVACQMAAGRTSNNPAAPKISASTGSDVFRQDLKCPTKKDGVVGRSRPERRETSPPALRRTESLGKLIGKLLPARRGRFLLGPGAQGQSARVGTATVLGPRKASTAEMVSADGRVKHNALWKHRRSDNVLDQDIVVPADTSDQGWTSLIFVEKPMAHLASDHVRRRGAPESSKAALGLDQSRHQIARAVTVRLPEVLAAEQNFEQVAHLFCATRVEKKFVQIRVLCQHRSTRFSTSQEICQSGKLSLGDQHGIP